MREVLYKAEDGVQGWDECRGLGERYKGQFLQPEGGVRDFGLSRGLGDMYKNQEYVG
mgnify:CR=1 FL=1